MKRCLADTSNLYGYRIKLYPTDEQVKVLDNLISQYRFVYNWTISEMNLYYEITGGYMPINDACQRFRDFRNSHEWLKSLPSNTGRHAIMSVYHSMSMFWKKVAKFPKFLTKKDSKQYFKIRGERLWFRDDHVSFEGIGGHGKSIKCGNIKLPFRIESCRFYACTVTFDGYNYWLSFNIEKHAPAEFYSDTGVLGIDVGLRKLAVLSDGTEYVMPKADWLIKRKKKLQRQLVKDRNRRIKTAKQARAKLDDIPETKNMLKHKKQLRQVCNKEVNIRHTFIHQMTSEIIERAPSAIVMETLNVKGMLKNKYLAKYISSACLSQVFHQIEYKAKRNPAIKVIRASRWYPSSQICSNCGKMHSPGDREWYKCPYCGFEIDRDLNAAINLSKLANG